MNKLTLWTDYTRKEVHSIFSPNTQFTPQAGTWGLQGIVRVPNRIGEWVFFVTFGQQQGDHSFDESITDEGVLSWQSQPSQSLNDKVIVELIHHDERINNIHLFLRTKKNASYSYLGKLGYLTHDSGREKPVYFQWQLLDWPIPNDKLKRIGIQLLHTDNNLFDAVDVHQSNTLQIVDKPMIKEFREGVGTQTFKARKTPNYAERDHKNRQLGLKGELLVLESEKEKLNNAGLTNLANQVRHVSVVEGDGAGYDIQSFFIDGRTKYIEVKTTKGGPSTPFYISPNEIAFSETHKDNFCLVRVFNYDINRNMGSAFELKGNISQNLNLIPTEFRATLKSD